MRRGFGIGRGFGMGMGFGLERRSWIGKGLRKWKEDLGSGKIAFRMGREVGMERGFGMEREIGMKRGVGMARELGMERMFWM